MPTLRKKKPVVLSSGSDEDEPRSPPPKRAKRGSTLLTASTMGAGNGTKPSTDRARRVSSSKSSTTSPRKAVTKSSAKTKPSQKPISSFFSKAVPVVRPSIRQEESPASTPVVDVDDILDSEDESSSRVQPTTPQKALPLRKGKSLTAANKDAPPKGSQKFARKPSAGQAPPAPVAVDAVDRRPWNEKYGPTSLTELAVHKKKVERVRDWLVAVHGRSNRKRLLLLKGPAGSGKTTALSLLSKEMGIHIHEWRNPTSSLSSSEGFVSATAQFEEFVGRTGTFGSLAFEGSTQSLQQTPPPDKQKQLILVEEFPNTFTRGSSIIQSFRSSVLNYLAAATPSATSFFSGQDSLVPVTPIVMIISETLLSTNTASADSFTAHRLLGPEILTHPGVTVIDFNPIAPTFMTKALDLIVLKEARKTGRQKTPGPQVIQHLTELGDIRSAVSSLEFLCLRGDDKEWGAKVDFSNAKKRKDVAMTDMERDSLVMVTQRESTLGIFHAVGRVVYNKRLPDDPSRPVPQPPTYFPQRRRPKAPEADVNALINELGTDTDTFVAALHENYVLSTDAGDSEDTLDCINGCVDALSDADLLSPDRFGRSGRNIQGSGADNLRQDEMSFQTSVRGLLYNLPNTVKRIAPPSSVMGTRAKGSTHSGAAKGSAYAMYYPSSLRLWREQEETGGLLEMWISRAQRGQLLVPTTVPTSAPLVVGGVDTWRKTTPFSKPSSNPAPSSSSPHPQEPPPPVLLGSGTSARTEMLLERLPYLSRILTSKSKPSPFQPFPSATAATLSELEKLTKFKKSTTTPAVDVDVDEEDAAAGLSDGNGVAEDEHWTTDKPGYDATPRKKRRGGWIARKGGEGGDVGVGESAVPLGLATGGGDAGAGGVLSDDDIED